MCGIAGGFAFDRAARPINPAIVSRLNEWQRRRGPDGVGLWAAEDKRFVLGSRRLAIVDSGDGGAQPMSDATGRWRISFNGEIYNYRALRLELESLGRIFHTNSDTEVLINVVAQWGEAGLLKLRGMFAFALWDALEEELWLARDPYGIKPLYVARAEARSGLHHKLALFRIVRQSISNANRPRSLAFISGVMCQSHSPGGQT